MDPRPYDALYDVKWQCLRLHLTKNWGTSGGIETNIVTLLKYIGGAKTPYWRFVRVWRVQNVLMQTRRNLAAAGQPNRRIDQTLAALERDYNKYLAVKWELQGRRPLRVKRGEYSGPFRSWNWMKVRTDLQELRAANPGLFDTLRRNLEGRAYSNPNLDLSRMRTDLSLAHFVRLLRDVDFEA
jgi:hypothetical protein